MDGVLPLLPPPELDGPGQRGGHADRLGLDRRRHPTRPASSSADAGVSRQSVSRSSGSFRCTRDAIESILSKCRKTSSSRTTTAASSPATCASETSFAADGHIRKYDGEPFMPHHIVDGVKAILAGKTKLYVPVHEIHGLEETTWTTVESKPNGVKRHDQGLQGQGRSRLVSRLRRLRRAGGAEEGDRRAGTRTAQGRDRQRHRLLVEPARLSSTPTACTPCTAARWRSRPASSWRTTT